jgi:molybdenum cofactor cytidylyltransferase
VRGVTGILLAAGVSARFGSNKLLEPLADGTPLAVAAARTLARAIPGSIAVVRPGDEALRGLFRLEGLRVVECVRADDGMGASLATGVAAAPDVVGWVIALGDMPWVQVATVRRVAESVAGGARIAVPYYRGRRGHPAGFANEFGDALRAMTGDIGARHLFERHADNVTHVDVDDRGIEMDVDAPRDLRGRD